MTAQTPKPITTRLVIHYDEHKPTVDVTWLRHLANAYGRLSSPQLPVLYDRRKVSAVIGKEGNLECLVVEDIRSQMKVDTHEYFYPKDPIFSEDNQNNGANQRIATPSGECGCTIIKKCSFHNQPSESSN